MQVATVWLNGQLLGTHANSGYTWFQFDITNKVSLTGTNVLAVQLDNTESLTIPPGRTAYNGVADYFLYSGIYRNVWLVCTDSCSIPLWSQRISIPAGNRLRSQRQSAYNDTGYFRNSGDYFGSLCYCLPFAPTAGRDADARR